MTAPTFAQRLGLKPLKAPQVDGMDRDLRNSLWNALFYYLKKLRSMPQSGFERGLRFQIWTRFFVCTADSMPPDDYMVEEPDSFWGYIRRWYFGDRAEWYDVYSFIEFVGSFSFSEKTNAYFEKCVNDELEAENGAYRFVNGKFAPITNEQELQAVRDAAKPPTTALAPVSTHIQKALELLSDKTNPDYRNSMKESISAVEALCKLIVGPGFKTLGPALEKTTKELGLNPDLRDGFKAIFQYTNDDHGIRHALKNNEQPDQADARFLLVACSAFVNYVTEKARKKRMLPK